MRRRECGFTVMAKDSASGQMTWGGLKAGLYQVAVRDFKETLWSDETGSGR